MAGERSFSLGIVRQFYSLGIRILGGAIALAALWDPKAREWRRGRKGILTRMAERINPQDYNIWLHSASLGEFEQGRPIIEELKNKYPGAKILVTFFSPSGYEIRKDYKGADYVFYLPADTPRNVRRFIKIVNPRIAIFVKYEFWVNYLLALKKHGTRTFIISAIFRPGQRFFKPWGGLFRAALRSFEHIFVQNTESKELLHTIGIDNVTIAGDTRFDRVWDIAAQGRCIEAVERFTGGERAFIAGSTWPPDEELLLRLLNENKGMKFIIAPHEIDRARIERFVAGCEHGAVCYTEVTEQTDLATPQVMIIDTIGILSAVYRYGKLAYIGGGFGVGIHNTLEATTFGLPIAFGPNYRKFAEARALVERGGAVSIDSYESLKEWFGRMTSDPAALERSSQACKTYTEENRGATGRILDIIVANQGD